MLDSRSSHAGSNPAIATIFLIALCTLGCPDRRQCLRGYNTVIDVDDYMYAQIGDMTVPFYTGTHKENQFTCTEYAAERMP